MLRLEYIKFQGFKSSSRIAELVFSRTPISVIYGPNGSGKTSLLRAISAFLSQDDAILGSLGIDVITCHFSYDEKISEFETVVVTKTDEGYDWVDFAKSKLAISSSLSLGVERGISTQSGRLDEEMIMEFFMRNPRYRHLLERERTSGIRELAEELSSFVRRRQKLGRKRADESFERAHVNLQNIKIENVEEMLLSSYRAARLAVNSKIQSALFDTLAVAIKEDEHKANTINDVPENFYSKLNDNANRIIQALNDDSKKNEFKNAIIAILLSLDEQNYQEQVLNKPLLIQLFKNMIVELDAEKLALGAISLLVETFNKYMIDEKKLIVSDSAVYIALGDSKHSISDLSSGERHILTFLSLVLFEGRKRDFLIIDEPEISLNIVWQRQLLDLFKELIPEVQIIAASHSPILARRNPDYLTPLKLSTVQGDLLG